jgi:hypothetical protein
MKGYPDGRRLIEGVSSLANRSKDAQDREEVRKQLQAQESAKAKAEYDAEGDAVRKRTARLKSLRLAKEAAEKEAAETKSSLLQKRRL